MERVRLDELTGGALQEKFDRAMETVIGNMQDPNTPRKTSGRSPSSCLLSRMRTGMTLWWEFPSPRSWRCEADCHPHGNRDGPSDREGVCAGVRRAQVRGQMSFSAAPGSRPSL